MSWDPSERLHLTNQIREMTTRPHRFLPKIKKVTKNHYDGLIGVFLEYLSHYRSYPEERDPEDSELERAAFEWTRVDITNEDQAKEMAKLLASEEFEMHYDIHSDDSFSIRYIPVRARA